MNQHFQALLNTNPSLIHGPWWRLRYLLIITLTCVSAVSVAEERERGGLSTVDQIFQDNCAICHGDRMQGTPQGSALVGNPLVHGESNADLIASISGGFTEQGMPPWSGQLDAGEIKSLALWIAENRDGLLYSDFRISGELVLSAEVQETKLASFTLQTVTRDLDPLPYSITVLPDDSIIVAEKNARTTDSKSRWPGLRSY